MEGSSPLQPTNSSKPNLQAADGGSSLDRGDASKPTDDASALYREVLQSEVNDYALPHEKRLTEHKIGVPILLDRLKQSITSMRVRPFLPANRQSESLRGI